jgi:hypothetical protein
MNYVKAKLAIACEYVAMGANGKHTLVNVYSGDIIVREFPARIPISFFIELESGINADKTLTIEVFSNKKRVAKAVAEFELEKERVGLINLPQLPLSLDGPTVLKVLISGDGIKSTTLLRKTISVGPIAD